MAGVMTFGGLVFLAAASVQVQPWARPPPCRGQGVALDLPQTVPTGPKTMPMIYFRKFVDFLNFGTRRIENCFLLQVSFLLLI